MLQDEEKRGILAVALLAAFADGAKAEQERESVRQVATSLGAEGGPLFSSILSDVMLRRVDTTTAAALLGSPESKLLAYEIAVQVCDADGLRGESENQFLESLRAALSLSQSDAAVAAEMPDTLAVITPDVSVQPSEPAAPKNFDTTIRNYAILCGALELLPQSIAGMAIIPLQVKMVREIGKAHGMQLGAAQVKDFMATIGIGLTSQYLESLGRKLIGGLLKRHVGKWSGSIGKGGTSMAMSFVTTYALGHVAAQYYAGGRRMDRQTLQAAYKRAMGEAQAMQGQYLPAMQQQAAGLDMATVMNLVRQAP